MIAHGKFEPLLACSLVDTEREYQVVYFHNTQLAALATKVDVGDEPRATRVFTEYSGMPASAPSPVS